MFLHLRKKKKCFNGAKHIKHMDDVFYFKQKEMTPIKFSKCHRVQTWEEGTTGIPK